MTRICSSSFNGYPVSGVECYVIERKRLIRKRELVRECFAMRGTGRRRDLQQLQIGFDGVVLLPGQFLGVLRQDITHFLSNFPLAERFVNEVDPPFPAPRGGATGRANTTPDSMESCPRRMGNPYQRLTPPKVRAMLSAHRAQSGRATR